VLWAIFALAAASQDPQWQPVSESLTAWGRVGGRGWTKCQDLERQAQAVPLRSLGQHAAERLWKERARLCPNVPAVLTLGAVIEIRDSARLLHGLIDTAGIVRAAAKHREVLERALRWLDTAILEAERRGEEPPAEARFRRAHALLALGRLAEARAGFEDASRRGEVPRWRRDRALALVDLLEGDLEAALGRAHRAVVYAPSEDRVLSGHVYALVLDRIGAPAAARRLIKRLRLGSGASGPTVALETALPVHERLYLRALVHQAHGDTPSALRLWDAYLARPEPEDPERELARRHRRELLPTPPPVEGSEP
jgi:tetratricopeptide (TPR) repeat protein